MTFISIYAICLLYLIAFIQIKTVKNSSSHPIVYLNEETPLIFVESPFKGDFTKGRVMPLSNKLGITQMHWTEAKFTIARAISNSDLGKTSSVHWKGANIIIRDSNGKQIFGYQFRDSSAFELEDLKFYGFIEPLSYANIPIAVAWKSYKLRDIAVNVVGVDTAIIAYTIVLPMEIVMTGSPITIEFTPIYYDGISVDEKTFYSQYLSVNARDRILRRHLTTSFRGVFEYSTLGNVYIPCIPNHIDRMLKITHDVIIDRFWKNNHFTGGTWTVGSKNRWMKLSFLLFRPAGKMLTKPLHRVGIYLKHLNSSSNIELTSFADSEIRSVKLSGNSEENAQKFKYGDRIPRDFATGLEHQTPPKWIPQKNIDFNIQIAKAGFQVERNKHGGVLPFHFEKANGRLNYYSVWIKLPSDFNIGRYQFMFKSFSELAGVEMDIKYVYTDDFVIVSDLIGPDRSSLFDVKKYPETTLVKSGGKAQLRTLFPKHNVQLAMDTRYKTASLTQAVVKEASVIRHQKYTTNAYANRKTYFSHLSVQKPALKTGALIPVLKKGTGEKKVVRFKEDQTELTEIKFEQEIQDWEGFDYDAPQQINAQRHLLKRKPIKVISGLSLVDPKITRDRSELEIAVLDVLKNQEQKLNTDKTIIPLIEILKHTEWKNKYANKYINSEMYEKWLLQSNKRTRPAIVIEGQRSFINWPQKLSFIPHSPAKYSTFMKINISGIIVPTNIDRMDAYKYFDIIPGFPKYDALKETFNGIHVFKIRQEVRKNTFVLPEQREFMNAMSMCFRTQLELGKEECMLDKC